MTSPTPDDQDAHDPHHILDQHEDFEQRLTTYLATVDDPTRLQGPLAELFRAIAHSYVQFQEADQDGNITVAEHYRLDSIVQAALDAREWLQEGR